MGCIYSATNMVNGKRYIGKTLKTLAKRKTQHLSAARRGTDNYLFHKAITKYGEENFHWEIYFEASDPTVLANLERRVIEYFGCQAPDGWGYNLTSGGEGVAGRTFTVSPETRAKISATMKGKRPAHIGPTAIAKMAASKRGKKGPPRTSEWLQHMSDGMKRRWQLGRHTRSGKFLKKEPTPCQPTPPSS